MSDQSREYATPGQPKGFATSEQPKGFTGESCKADGTYVSEAGAKQYYAEAQPFGPEPVTGQETYWTKAT